MYGLFYFGFTANDQLYEIGTPLDHFGFVSLRCRSLPATSLEKLYIHTEGTIIALRKVGWSPEIHDLDSHFITKGEVYVQDLGADVGLSRHNRRCDQHHSCASIYRGAQRNCY